MKNLLRTAVAIAGVAVGPSLVVAAYEFIDNFAHINLYEMIHPWVNVAVFMLSAVLFGILFLLLSKPISEEILRVCGEISRNISRAPAKTIVLGTAGLVVGLLVAFLLSWPLDKLQIPWIVMTVNIILYVVCGYMGVSVAVKTSEKLHMRQEGGEGAARGGAPGCPKLLDTSAIIDGRIFDICKTGVVEGKIVIPGFVLGELRHIADSQDPLRRAKGRRGLDILDRLQKELKIPVEISDLEYEDLPDSDAKLLRLAKELGAKVITNDFNLNKVAKVQDIAVLNVNELANAVKPVLLPGEELSIRVVKQGKDTCQGVGYLEDGTMIVVENGGGHIGEELNVFVTSALQTAAGRMVFARVKEEEES